MGLYLAKFTDPKSSNGFKRFERLEQLERFEPGFRSRTGSHEQGTNLPQRRRCVLPLKAAAVSALRNDGKQMELRAGAKKDFETNSRVSSLLQVCPSLTFSAESGLNIVLLTLGCCSRIGRLELRNPG
jgi:hypothetical protein